MSDAVNEYFSLLTLACGWGIMFFGAWRLYRRWKEYPWDQDELEKAWQDDNVFLHPSNTWMPRRNVQEDHYGMWYQEDNPWTDPRYSWMPGNIFNHDHDDMF